jgi:hypothetical protein
MFTRSDFDPLATVIDWLDACRAGEIDSLLALYDNRATLHCDCEGMTLTGVRQEKLAKNRR